jgi:hypothetical protein
VADFTERQAKAWPAAVAEIQRYVDTSTVPEDLNHHEWTVQWEDETRPGRGHRLNAVWSDGEYVAQVLMDVYGGPSVSVGEVTWIHNSSDEECLCGPCEAQRRADDEPAVPCGAKAILHPGAFEVTCVRPVGHDGSHQDVELGFVWPRPVVSLTPIRTAPPSYPKCIHGLSKCPRCRP